MEHRHADWQNPSAATIVSRVICVQSGDTLFRIAGCFNTTTEILAAANDLSDPNANTPRQRLYVRHD